MAQTRGMFRRHPVLSFATIGYLAVVGWVTLGPQPLDHSGRSILWSVLHAFSRHRSTEWITYDVVEFSANVAMFVPVGLFFLLLLGRRRAWLAILLGVLLTVGIETAQLFIAGRVADPRDVLSNSLGALIGVLFALVVTAPAARRDRIARQRAAEDARRRAAHGPVGERVGAAR
jgi:glycopeptide antibiotics resistance protein